MANYYQKKPKARFLIPLVVILLIVSVLMFSCSVFMSRRTRYVIDESTLKLAQLEEPKAGDTVAVIKTSLGDISVRLYPEYAPNTVENFISLAEKDYYDNTLVYNIISGTAFQAGTSEKSGVVPADSGTNEKIEMEYSQDLWPFRGALYAVTSEVESGVIKTFMNTAKRYGGSRFGICNTIEMDDELKESLVSGSDETQKMIGEKFVELGGIPNYSQQMTIFGQVYEGFDVLDAITGADCEAETNYNGYTLPKEDILILDVVVTKYSE